MQSETYLVQTHGYATGWSRGRSNDVKSAKQYIHEFYDYIVDYDEAGHGIEATAEQRSNKGYECIYHCWLLSPVGIKRGEISPA